MPQPFHKFLVLLDMRLRLLLVLGVVLEIRLYLSELGVILSFESSPVSLDRLELALVGLGLVSKGLEHEVGLEQLVVPVLEGSLAVGQLLAGAGQVLLQACDHGHVLLVARLQGLAVAFQVGQ
jgi:hypothetical protein